MLRVSAVFGLLLSLAFTETALAQPQPQVVISAPANGATVAGPNVTVTINVTGTTLVPAAQEGPGVQFVVTPNVEPPVRAR